MPAERRLRIVVIHHEREAPANMGRYLIADFAEAWRRDGHVVVNVAGVGDLPDGDVGILHVDLSVMPPRYAAAAARYPLLLNGTVSDIRKRRVSQALAPRGYLGPVIVKTDRNYGGRPEIERMPRWRARLARALRRVGGAARAPEYPVYRSIDDVPRWYRWQRGRVVERFLPEREGAAYCVRQTMFLGARAVSWRLCGEEPVVRTGASTIDEEVPTPATVDAFRRAIGLDYGKVDYLEAEGRAVVIDVGKTIGIRGSAPETVQRLAGGLADLWMASGRR